MNRDLFFNDIAQIIINSNDKEEVAYKILEYLNNNCHVVDQNCIHYITSEEDLLSCDYKNTLKQILKGDKKMYDEIEEAPEEVNKEYGIDEVLDRWTMNDEANTFLKKYIYDLKNKLWAKEMLDKNVKAIVKDQARKVKHLFPLENTPGYGQLCDHIICQEKVLNEQTDVINGLTDVNFMFDEKIKRYEKALKNIVKCRDIAWITYFAEDTLEHDERELTKFYQKYTNGGK